MVEIEVPKVKVLILGDSAVGKTAILGQFVNREFTTQYRPTIGSDFTSRQVEVNGSFVTLQIWDTAGQERYRALAPRFFRGTDICVFVYDVTLESSFESIKTWHRVFVHECSPIRESFPFLLLGNKIDDGGKRVVATERGRQLAGEHDFLFFEVSAKSCENVADAFEAVVKRAMERRGPFEEKEFHGRMDLDNADQPQRAGACPC
jgi:Ras-related protein Rab-7A